MKDIYLSVHERSSSTLIVSFKTVVYKLEFRLWVKLYKIIARQSLQMREIGDAPSLVSRGEFSLGLWAVKKKHRR